MKFVIDLNEEDAKRLDRDRGEISRNAYITEMIRGYRLGVVKKTSMSVPSAWTTDPEEVNATFTTISNSFKGKLPVSAGTVLNKSQKTNRPKSLEEEMLGI